MKLNSLLILSIAFAATACGGAEESSTSTQAESATSAPTAASSDLAAGAEFYAQTCIPCHGEGGKGDGAASAALTPKPRDLTGKEWQDSIDDEYLRKIIQYGGAAVGKSPTMPANPVLGSQKEVLNGLVEHIRTLEE